MVRFAHLADCHIGAWRDSRLSDLADESFLMAITRCIEEAVDFVVIAGDLFHTALPGIERLRHTVKCLELLKQQSIPVYVIPGSHDYSPTGKTMLSVLQEAGLVVNVYRELDDAGTITLEPVVDKKTGVTLVGVLGRAGQLDTEKYGRLDRDALNALSSPKVFLFHAALSDLVSSRLAGSNAASVSLLPSGFDYYAGGHVHIIKDVSVKGYPHVVYPGPTFPANFSELEELGGGSFCFVDLDSDSFTREYVKPRVVEVVQLECSNKSAQEVSSELFEEIEGLSVENAVILVRAKGTLASGSAADIEFASAFIQANQRGAYACLKSTSAVSSPEMMLAQSEVSSSNTKQIEAEVIEKFTDSKELAGSPDQQQLMHNLLSSLAQRQAEGEIKKDYEKRIVADAKKLLE
jgi:DNA repair exonuclease SbcCD nuclease subunit